MHIFCEPHMQSEEIDIDLDDPETEKAALKIQQQFKKFKMKKGPAKSGTGSVNELEQNRA